jgi:hypothetical protein
MATENPAPVSGKIQLNKPFMWLIILAGITVSVWSVAHVKIGSINVQFLVLAFATLVFGSRIGVQIPHVKAEITVSDTFIFLILLLYGGRRGGSPLFLYAFRYAMVHQSF